MATVKRSNPLPRQEPLRVPIDSHQTKMKTNRNWNRRYQDGHHKPKEKK